MASIHILKSGLYPLSSSSSNLNSRNGKRLICNGNNGYLNLRSDRRSVVAVKCKAQDTDDSDSKVMSGGVHV
ncbi:hypothetical protein Tco_1046854 [Tanacetum coccineum]